MPIAQGSRVTLHYTLCLASGRLVESTRESGPATIAVGKSDWLPMFENCLLGLEAGDKRAFAIPADEAYGAEGTESVHVMERSEFPPEMKLEPGQVIGFETPGGDEIPGVVLEVGPNEVRVDFTHPLSGHDLVLDVEILDVT